MQVGQRTVYTYGNNAPKLGMQDPNRTKVWDWINLPLRNVLRFLHKLQLLTMSIDIF